MVSDFSAPIPWDLEKNLKDFKKYIFEDQFLVILQFSIILLLFTMTTLFSAVKYGLI
jgi:hypothetical protein